MFLGILMIFSSLGLLIFNSYEDKHAGKVSEEMMDNLVRVIDEVETNQSDQMPIVKIGDYEYVGYISIPVLDLELPIQINWNYSKMRKSPCVHKGSISTNDLVIAGHAYKKHFGRLKNLNVGDQIIITNMNGDTFEYEVMAKEVIDGTKGKEILYSEYDLTLYTCTYLAKERVTIRANRK